MVIELMGRYAGRLALHAGLAGAAHAILLPEIDFDIDKLCASVCHRWETGRRFAVIVVSEGAKPKGSGLIFKSRELGRSPCSAGSER